MRTKPKEGNILQDLKNSSFVPLDVAPSLAFLLIEKSMDHYANGPFA